MQPLSLSTHNNSGVVTPGRVSVGASVVVVVVVVVVVTTENVGVSGKILRAIPTFAVTGRAPTVVNTGGVG